MHAQVAQQAGGRIERGWGVVIAPHHHNIAAAGGLHVQQKGVIQLQGRIGGRAGIEDVAGYYQHFHLLDLDRFDQPV